ncbi:MFS family permease [Sphingobium fontiphilum]|uniref:MFS family permease n=1 Tax=Sphingobium fontiphilum TaxID=944425 RepID=A0A7W6GPB8_9SPHN|nr:MFS transporter [Sphingobium fontiphilum]MBB3982233.1 MFS family permease [Sphingobium fontiphilum]
MSGSTGEAQAYGYRWIVLLVLTLAHSCHIMDRMVVSIVMEPVRHEFDLNDTQLGLISSLGYGLFYGAAVLPMGMLIDRTVRKNALAFILALWSGMTAVCGLATSWIMLLVSRCLVGLAESGGSPAGLSLLSDFFPPRERSTAVGLWYLSSAIGSIVTFIVGGMVAAAYGWRMAFLLAGVPGMIMAVVVFFVIREPVRGASDGTAAERAARPAPEKLGFARSLAEIGARPAAVHILLGVLLTAAAISSYSTWSISFLVRQHSLLLSQAGLTVGLTSGLLGALGGAFFGWLADRSSRRDPRANPWRSGMIAAGTSLAATFLGIASLLTPETVAALTLVACYAFFFNSYNGPANGLLLIVVPPQVRGFTIALLQLGATLLGFGVAPFIVGRLSDMIGGSNSLGWALSIMLLCHPLAALHFALAARHVRRTGTGRSDGSQDGLQAATA